MRPGGTAFGVHQACVWSPHPSFVKCGTWGNPSPSLDFNLLLWKITIIINTHGVVVVINGDAVYRALGSGPDIQEVLSQCCVCALSRVWLFVTSWTVAHQTPLSKEFSRQEYWSRLPDPFPGDLSNTGIKLRSLTSSALAGGFLTTSATIIIIVIITIIKRWDCSLFF